MVDPDEVLDFWFGDLSGGDEAAPDEATMQRWWQSDDAFDEEIASRFGTTLARAAAGELDGWAARGPRGRLALIVVLDQFSRNLYRGRPDAFAQDEAARELTRVGIDSGEDQALRLIERVFFYMPLEHSEDLEDQEQAVAQFEQLLADAPADQKDRYDYFLDFAQRHHDIIARFGRFPHRNAILERPSNHEEMVYLAAGAETFGQVLAEEES